MPGTSGPLTTVRPVSASTRVPYREGTYTAPSLASAMRRSARGTPARLSRTQVSATSVAFSSPSPMTKASKNGATGSGWVAVGPPPSTSGSPSPRSADRSGTPPRSSMVRMLL